MPKEISSPLPGIVTQILVQPGDEVRTGQNLVLIEAMKMENALSAPCDGKVTKIHVLQGSLVEKEELVMTIDEAHQLSDEHIELKNQTTENKALEDLRERRQKLSDEARPAAVEKRRKKNRLTAREGISRLVDKGSFREYGGLVIAAQRTRRSLEDLITNTPADGLVVGVAAINSDLTEGEHDVAVMAYDYTVLAGTQGTMNHMKMDRLLGVASERDLPVILLAEGGGGRPGDVDVHTIGGLFISTFTAYAAQRAKVPTIAIVTGYCFAGNAALAGSSDLIIAAKDVSLGMGGPAMIAGGGLGDFHPKEVGPADVQSLNGVIDVRVENDAEGVDVAKKYLSYFQGHLRKWTYDDQEVLQDFIPTDRKRTFDMKQLITHVCDHDSLLFLRESYAPGMITCMGRVAGRAVGIIANDCRHDAGAITAACARKASAMIERCNRYNLPIISFIDTPGIMVGPASEEEGTVRAAGDLFAIGAAITVPMISIVIRRCYGLGAMAMSGGSSHQSLATIAWPSGELGAMGIEGAVRLGYRKELEAVQDPGERDALFEKMVDELYEKGKAISAATYFELDEVIEPQESRPWIQSILRL